MRVGRSKPVVNGWVALLAGALLCSSTLLMAQAGSLDPTFGNGGIVTTKTPTTLSLRLFRVNGKILVAGSIPNSQGVPELGVARYNTNGSLDSSFGNGGFSVISGNPAFGIAIQSDEKIVIGAAGNLRLLVIRLNTNGSLDTTFGGGGIASFRQFGLSTTSSLAVLSCSRTATSWWRPSTLPTVTAPLCVFSRTASSTQALARAARRD